MAPKKKKVSLPSQVAQRAGAYPGFRSTKRLGLFLLLLDGGASPSQVTSQQFVRFPQQFAGTHLYSWVERGTPRVKCLAEEHDTVSPARARTRTARSGVERTNHEATAPPTMTPILCILLKKKSCFLSFALSQKFLQFVLQSIQFNS